MTGELHLPDYEGGSIVNLAASVLDAFGVEPPGPPLRPELLPPEALGGPGGVVLLVIDALGHASLLSALGDRTPNLTRLAGETPGGLRRLTSIFPSTTSAALNSLATAEPPSVHGVLGHTLWLEEVGSMVSMLTLRPLGGSEPLSEEAVRRVPTVYERLARAGVPSTVITDAAYEGAPFTNLIQEGARFLGHRSLSHLCHLLGQALDEGGGRAFYSLYWPVIDTLSHLHGPDGSEPSEACRLEMEFIDLMVGKVHSLCRQHGCTLLVTADHGQTRVDPDLAFPVEGALLEALSRPPGGGRRAFYFEARDPERILSDEGLRQAAEPLLPADEAVAAGWFGGPCDGVRSRLGDVVALAGPDGQLLYDYGRGRTVHRGSHAGLTAEEMYVPLIAAVP
ncbi:MAG: alkaline phosphatase family protein [Gemmatimonadaceae bacterium]|nr:alkaline phosphatase family protein [Gemmatimonadaceae bacterium]